MKKRTLLAALLVVPMGIAIALQPGGYETMQNLPVAKIEVVDKSGNPVSISLEQLVKKPLKMDIAKDETVRLGELDNMSGPITINSQHIEGGHNLLESLKRRYAKKYAKNGINVIITLTVSKSNKGGKAPYYISSAKWFDVPHQKVLEEGPINYLE